VPARGARTAVTVAVSMDFEKLTQIGAFRATLNTPDAGFVSVIVGALQKIRNDHGFGAGPGTSRSPSRSAPPVISRSDLFLRPTTTDGDAVSVREALELGVPVVASDAVPRPDAVVLYRAGDLADFVAKVREALERGRDGAVAVPQESAVDAIERIYEKLLGAVALGRGKVDDERAVGRAR